MQERSVEALSRGSALIGGRFPGNRGPRPSSWGHDVRFRSRKLGQRYCSFNFHLHHADYGLARPIWTPSAARGSRQAMTAVRLLTARPRPLCNTSHLVRNRLRAELRNDRHNVGCLGDTALDPISEISRLPFMTSI
jgi:hypothetical protein